MLAVVLVALVAAQTPVWPPVDDPVAPTGGGENDAAVLVGVSSSYKLPAIAGAADNARAWQNYLLRVRKVPASRVTTLTDASATRERILAAATEAARDVTPGGTLWFVFIGHGAPAPSGKDGLLVGADAQPEVDSLAARGVAQSEVLSVLATGRHAESVVVFDACFSGRSPDGSVDLVDNVMATVPVRRAIAVPLTVLSSSDTFAGPLPGTTRPAFSYLLLGALRGWGDTDQDRHVAIDEAFAFTRETLQASFGSRSRLPSMSGAPSGLRVPARVAAPDITALTSGSCPRGTGWDGNRCREKAAVSCPPGSSWNGDACVSLCPAATVWNGRACAASKVECPAGSSWNGSACVAPVSPTPTPTLRSSTPVPSAASGPVAIPVGDSPILGPKKAPHTLVIFTDLQCPFCLKVHSSLRDWVDDPRLKGKLKVVFKHFPLAFHAEARPAARAALAARAVGGDEAFWAMTDSVFRGQRRLNEYFYAAAAEELGLDADAFARASAKVGSADAIISRDIALGEKLNVRGTPTLFVNGVELRNRTVEGILDIVNATP